MQCQAYPQAQQARAWSGQFRRTAGFEKITPCRRFVQQNLVGGHSFDQIFAASHKKLQFSKDTEFKIQTHIKLWLYTWKKKF